MSKRGWLTPDVIPSAVETRALFIPDDVSWLSIVTGALSELTYAFNWEQFGTLTPEECAQRMLQMVIAFTDGTGEPRLIGEIAAYDGSSAPNSAWLMCNGQSLLRTDYPELFAVIGTAYGAVDSAHFNIPDLRGKTLIHQSSGYPLANAVGEETHTLTSAEMPVHNHTDTGHTHTTGNSLTGVALTPGELPVLLPNPIPALTGVGNASIGNAGSGNAHNNMQPSMPISYVIRATY